MKEMFITLRRNLRWSAEAFEVGCWNGEKVCGVFALDCYNREIMGFSASTCGISGSMVRDLMLECVEKRFGMSHAPHRVEWLTDNGSCFVAKETVEFASCGVYQPGMAESFVKTFKRDYMYVNDCPDAQPVREPAWGMVRGLQRGVSIQGPANAFPQGIHPLFSNYGVSGLARETP